MNEELPVLRALVLADHIYTDATSGQRVIAGTFNRLHMPVFPCMFGRWTAAFILLDDFDGEIKLRLRFVNLRNNAVLMESPMICITNPERLVTADIAFAVPPFPLPEAGVYSLECYVNDSMIGSVRIEAVQLPSEENSNA